MPVVPPISWPVELRPEINPRTLPRALLGKSTLLNFVGYSLQTASSQAASATDTAAVIRFNPW